VDPRAGLDDMENRKFLTQPLGHPRGWSTSPVIQKITCLKSVSHNQKELTHFLSIYCTAPVSNIFEFDEYADDKKNTILNKSVSSIAFYSTERKSANSPLLIFLYQIRTIHNTYIFTMGEVQ
jgi:hypothetical protein